MLATWHQLIDLGSLLDGDEYLAGTARPPVVRLAKATAEALGVADGDPVTVGTDRGALTLPAALTEMPDGVVWLPTNSPGSTVRRALGATSGAVVNCRRRTVVHGPRATTAAQVRDRISTRERRMTYLAQDPTLADFGHDPWWLVLIKIVVAFVFGMLA